MSIDSAQDPRNRLVREKYFSLHPKPLERWLWQHSVPQAAERVFWLHWEEGMRSGDWCSEVPVKRVANLCCIDPSTVTRSYQLLKTLGLIKREDPGRDPNNPFQQATAITEVRIPRELLTELARSPNRAAPGRLGSPQARPMQHNTPMSHEVVAGAPRTPESPDSMPIAPILTPAATTRLTRQETQAMWSRASAGERARFFAASRDGLTRIDFDADTRLNPNDRGHLLTQLEQLARAKHTAPPAPIAKPAAARTPDYAKPRRLSVLELARTRKRVGEVVPSQHAGEILRQVIWAVEEGALRRFEMPLAVNIALKKIREGSWSKPNRMPPNWARLARPEMCGAA